MLQKPYNYNIFFDFIESYLPAGFNNINPTDPIMEQLEKLMEENNQFLYIADLIQLKILYTSKRCANMVGIPPEQLEFSHFMETVHPDDAHRLNIGRTKLLTMAQDFFIAETGTELLSTNMRFKNASGKYSNWLLQNYMFFTTVPNKTVYFLKIHTDIDDCKKLKCGYHYYSGADISYFRFPDDDLLQLGPLCTEREMQIVQLIEAGLSTKEIAQKLFLSHHTVSKHRANILEKCRKETTWDLILDFKKQGLL